MKAELSVHIVEVTGELLQWLENEASTLSGYRFHAFDASVIQTIALGGMSLLFR